MGAQTQTRKRGQEANLFKVDGRWGVRLKLPVHYRKHEYKRLIGSKADAIEERDRVKKLIRLRQPLEPQEAQLAPGNTLASFLEEAARAWKRRDPRHVYVKRWAAWSGAEQDEEGRWVGGMAIGHITRPRIQEAARELEELGYSGATIRMAITTLKAAFDLAEDTGNLHHHPLAKHLKLPPANKRKKYVPIEALFRLVAVMGRYGVMAEFAVLTGLRCMELLSLTWPDVCEGTLEITKTKQREAHTCYLVGRLREILLQQVGESPKWVFPAPMGNRWDYAAWSKRRRAWFKEAGLEGYVWHDLRHTAASYALSSGEPLAAIGVFLGHAEGSTQHTRRYAHLLPQTAQRVPQTIAGYLYPALEEN